MEIQEDVKIEFGEDAEADVSIGMRAATSIPRYTKEELKAGLGKDVDGKISRLLSRLAGVPAAAAEED